MIGKYENRLIEKVDLIRIAILVAIALAIGVYLIATTVLIAEDGVSYIKRAQQFLKDPISVKKAYSPGYSFLIFVAHKFISLFSNGTSVQVWIYSAQGVTLLCRLLALIPLYLIGKLLVGGKNSFWAILILTFLPYPAEFGSDVIREWPHVLFLSTALLFLIWGAKFGKPWMFAVTGTLAGLGHTIRPECAQVVIYGILWLLISMFLPRLGMSRLKSVCAMQILLIGFVIPAAPYMKVRGSVLPPKLKKVISWNKSWECGGIEKSSFNGTIVPYAASAVSVDILKALGILTQRMSENLIHFFMLPLGIGLYYHFHRLRKILLAERFFIFALVVMYLVMMVLLYINYGYISRRHCMPIIVFTAFYIPIGLGVVGDWLKSKFPMNREREEKKFSWFLVLFLIGMGICIPKLFRPIRIEKQGYRAVVNWLLENTAPKDMIVVPDRRIAFYANRAEEKMQTGTNMISGGKITPGKWYHLAGTYDGKYQKLYINGKLVASAEPELGFLSAGRDNLAIGKRYIGAKSCFKGILDEVRLYNKALSEEEIKALYNKLLSQVGNSALIGHWPMEGDVPGINCQSKGAMAFSGTTDYIDLPHLGSKLNAGNLGVSLWTKPELIKSMNWILGNRAQFRIGIRNSKVYFWIRESSPGHKIPAKAAYVAKLLNKDQIEEKINFNRKVRKRYSVWMNKRKKQKKIVVYEVMK